MNRRGMEREREGPRRGRGKREKRQRKVTQTCPIWPFRLTRFPFLTPYSRSVSTRLALGGPSPCPVIPSLHAQTPDDAPNGTDVTLLCSTSAPASCAVPRPSDAEIWWRSSLTAGISLFPPITSRALIFSSLIHHHALDCLALWLWLWNPSYSFPRSCALFDTTFFFASFFAC